MQLLLSLVNELMDNQMFDKRIQNQRKTTVKNYTYTRLLLIKVKCFYFHLNKAHVKNCNLNSVIVCVKTAFGYLDSFYLRNLLNRSDKNVLKHRQSLSYLRLQTGRSCSHCPEARHLVSS